MSLTGCMRIIGFLVIMATVILSSATCENTTNQSATENGDSIGDASQFAIYLVAHFIPPGMEVSDLSQLELQDEPWLSIDDIDFYDFSAHLIYLKEGKSLWLAPSATPFVVIANGQRCYLGYFYSMISSYIPRGPTIQTMELRGEYREDVVHISGSMLWIPGETYVDVRDDERVANALRDAGKYSAGLRVQLNEVVIVAQSDVTTLSYTFTVTNEDDDSLYVPDPDKMGTSRFHYWTNGPYLQSLEDGTSFWSEHKATTAPDPFYSWDIEWLWFTKIESHKSMERTVVLEGYPIIPAGRYSCYFDFNSSYFGLIFPDIFSNMDKAERALADGRIWIGHSRSNTIEVDIVS